MTIEATTTVSDTSSKSESANPKTEKLVSDLFSVGALWASHGLTIARSSLEASSETLKRTASVLGNLAESFEDRSKKQDPRAT